MTTKIDYVEYTFAMQKELKQIIKVLGLKLKNKPHELQQFIVDAAFEVFIVDYKNLSHASAVGYEMKINAEIAAAYYAYLIAMTSAEEQPTGWRNFFRKKEEIEIDYSNIVFSLFNLIMASEDYGNFCEKWAFNVQNKIGLQTENNEPEFLVTIKKIFENTSKVPLEHKAEVVEMSIRTHLGLYEQEDDSAGEKLYKLLKIYFCEEQSWEEMVMRLDAFEKIALSFNVGEKSIITYLTLAKYRRFVTKTELLDYGVQAINAELINQYQLLGINYLESNEPPSILT